MLVDIFIILNALGDFFIFLLLHVILFRNIKPENVIKWLFILYLIMSITAAGFSVWAFKQLTSSDLYQNLNLVVIAVTLILIIFSLLISVYIIGIFGVIESSVRIKLLSLIADTKTNGITEKGIYKKYNKKSIINKRLLRMKSSGDLIFLGGKYYQGKRWSLLSFMIHVSEFITWLYK